MAKAKARKSKTTKTTTKTTTKAKAVNKPRTKSDIYRAICDDTGLARAEVNAVFGSMTKIMKKDLGRRGPGIFTVPGLMKVRAVKKPRTSARTVPNPFKPGEMMSIKAKPARTVVKVRALKALKEMV